MNFMDTFCRDYRPILTCLERGINVSPSDLTDLKSYITMIYCSNP